jgi:GNAT superfamily N-acetyltransferase
VSSTRLTIVAATIADAGEMLTLQRAAYVTEAQIYDDPRLPALTRTLLELQAELGTVLSFKASSGGRLIGAVRVAVRDSNAEIGRLVVAPDQQGRGLGRASSSMSTPMRLTMSIVSRCSPVTAATRTSGSTSAWATSSSIAVR